MIVAIASLRTMDSPPNEDEENGSGDRPHDAQHEQVNRAVVSFGPARQGFHGHEGQRIDHGLSVASMRTRVTGLHRT